MLYTWCVESWKKFRCPFMKNTSPPRVRRLKTVVIQLMIAAICACAGFFLVGIYCFSQVYRPAGYTVPNLYNIQVGMYSVSDIEDDDPNIPDDVPHSFVYRLKTMSILDPVVWARHYSLSRDVYKVGTILKVSEPGEIEVVGVPVVTAAVP